MDRISVFIVAFFCACKLALHLIADGNSGFQGDELLHIQTGNHLAFGYNEFPPLIGLLAYLQNLMGSTSVYVHHIFTHLAAILILIFVAKSVLELGGKYFSLIIVLTCILIAPGFGRSQQLFQPVVFSQLFWVLSAYQLIRYLKYFDKRFLWYLTISLALAFLSKYDSVFLIATLPALLFFKKVRFMLVKHKFWRHALIFVLLISTNLIWQFQNDFRVWDMMQRLKETQLDHQSPLDVLVGIALAINPLSLIIYIPAFYFMFSKGMHRFRPFAVLLVIAITLLALNQAKDYYYFPIVLILLPFGALFWEFKVLRKRKKLIYPLMVFLFFGFGIIAFGMPLSSLDSYLKNEYQFEKEEKEGLDKPIRFEERYSKLHWESVLTKLSKVHARLVDSTKQETVIWAKHYKQAGAVELFGSQYGLPKAFSLHGSFYNWLPEGNMPSTVLAFRSSGADGKDFFEPYFESVEAVQSIYNPYAKEEEDLWTTIFICKNPKQSFDQLKQMFAHRIFE